MGKLWLATAALLALTLGVSGRRCPLLHAPESANKTGCYIVVLRENTTDEKVAELLQRTSSVAEEHKVYGFIQNVAKAITVKLSDYSMEMVSTWYSWSIIVAPFHSGHPENTAFSDGCI